MKKKILSVVMLLAMVFSVLACTPAPVKVDASQVQYASGSRYVYHNNTEIKLWAKFAYRDGWVGTYDHDWNYYTFGNSYARVTNSTWSDGTLARSSFTVNWDDGATTYVTIYCDNAGHVY